jgi:hypothetical protein
LSRTSGVRSAESAILFLAAWMSWMLSTQLSPGHGSLSL